MATSRFPTELYPSSAFVESAGAILFRLSTRQVCIVHHLQRDEYVLAKGRRNCNESRPAAALREAAEETGYRARLLPVTMTTRAPPAVETEPSDDKPRQFDDICEPFYLQLRRLDGEGGIKLIWWYVAAVDESVEAQQSESDADKFRVEFHGYDDVLAKLTFQTDREVVQRAIELVRAR